MMMSHVCALIVVGDLSASKQFITSEYIVAVSEKGTHLHLLLFNWAESYSNSKCVIPFEIIIVVIVISPWFLLYYECWI